MNVPVGGVTAYAGSPFALEEHWKVCDGQPLSREDHPQLFRAIGTSWGGDGNPTFFLPDLRGQFLRGVDRKQDGTEDQTTLRDPDRNLRTAFQPSGATNPGNFGNAVGSFQGTATAQPANAFTTDITGEHQHGDPTWNALAGPYELATHNRGPGGFDYGAQSAPTTASGNHSHKIVGGGDKETRPINAYVYFIIRVR